MKTYKFYTDEIHRVHGTYMIKADSYDEAMEKLSEEDIDDCWEDLFDREIQEIELLEVYE